MDKIAIDGTEQNEDESIKNEEKNLYKSSRTDNGACVLCERPSCLGHVLGYVLGGGPGVGSGRGGRDGGTGPGEAIWW